MGLPACYGDQVPVPYDYGNDDASAGSEAPVGTSMPTATTTTTSTAPPPDAESPPDGQPDAGTKPSEGGSVGPKSACDLTGRWIASDHQVLNGLGAQEAAHVWYYFELTQNGDVGSITKGMDCGENVSAISAVGANETSTKAWPAYQAKIVLAGRKFTSTASGSGCTVTFDKAYQVIGATVPYYLDPSTTMPTASQQATGSTPGWEDWDNDGNPGVTQNSTGLVTGQLYLAARRSTIWSGPISASPSTFKLTDDWTNDPDDLGYNGSSLLTTQAGKDSNTSLQFIEFARLSATQATGSNDSICMAIRSLAPTLTPSGAGN